MIEVIRREPVALLSLTLVIVLFGWAIMRANMRDEQTAEIQCTLNRLAQYQAHEISHHREAAQKHFEVIHEAHGVAAPKIDDPPKPVPVAVPGGCRYPP